MTDQSQPDGVPSAKPADETAEFAGETAGEQTRADVDGAPARGGFLASLWGNPRRRLLLAVGAAVVVVAVVGTVIVTGSANRPVPSGTMPELGTQFAGRPSSSDPSRPGEPDALPAYSGTPLWTFNSPAADNNDSTDVPNFAVTDNGFVLKTDEDVLGLDRKGNQVWNFPLPDIDDFTVRVAGAQVFVGYPDREQDRWPQPKVVIALSAATGAELWRETEASFWSVTTDTIYLSVCYGGQNDKVGDCTLSARNPANNTIRWSTPTYASSRVENMGSEMQAEPTPPALLVGAYRTGSDTYSVAAHDSATGALRGRGFANAEGDVRSIDLATDRTVVTVDDKDDNPANGCTAAVTGFSLSAKQIWQHTVATAKIDDGRKCGKAQVSYNGDKMGVTTESGAPSVLNVNTGALEWSAPAGGMAVAAGGTTLLAAVDTEDGAELVAYRIGNATPVWRAPFPRDRDAGYDSGRVIMTASVAVVPYGMRGVPGYDLATGKAWSYGDTVPHSTATGFVACTGTVCRGYATA